MPLKLPTPPTPPTIDKGEATESTPRIDAHEFFNIPFKHESKEKPAEISTEKPAEKISETPPPVVERKVTTPEDMAREAVANGAGALTKKTVTRPDEENISPPQNNSATQNISPAPAVSNLPVQTESQSRGKEILREFQNEDKQTFQDVETPRTVTPNNAETHGGFYWIITLLLIGILSVVFVRKVLVKKNPPLKKSDLFTNSSERLNAISEKVTAPKISEPKINSVEKISEPAPPKTDDGKGKHFEVRI